MLTFILIIIFLLYALIEAVAYGYYEFRVNQNKFAGFSLMFLAVVGFVLSIVMYFVS